MKQGEIVKTLTSKSGQHVTIRHPHKDDLDSIHAYAIALANEDTFVELVHPPTREEEEKFVTAMLEKMEKGEGVYLVLEIEGKIVGMTHVEKFNKHRKKHVGQVALAIQKDHRDEGIGSEFFRALIEEADKTDFKLLMLTCFANNFRAIHVYEKMGFVKYGVLPKAIFYKGEYVDEVQMYKMLSD